MAINGDLFANFAYCKCTGPVGASDTTIVVDDITRLPMPLQAGAIIGDQVPAFWMTFDSALGATNTFEIVRVTNVDAATKALTVDRGQEGTTAVAHDAGTYLKGTFTAGMASRAAGAPLVTTLTPPVPGAGSASGRLALRVDDTTNPQMAVPYAWAEWGGGFPSAGNWFPLDGFHAIMAVAAAGWMAGDGVTTSPVIIDGNPSVGGLFIDNGTLQGGHTYSIGIPPGSEYVGGAPNFTTHTDQVNSSDAQQKDITVVASAGRCWVAWSWLIWMTGLSDGDIVAISNVDSSFDVHDTYTVMDATINPDDGSWRAGGTAVRRAGSFYTMIVALKTAATNVAITRIQVGCTLLAGNPLE